MPVETLTLKDFERALSRVILRLSHRHVSEDIARRTGLVLSPASWSLLEYLDELGPMRVSDVADCHGLDVSTVTPRLKALEKDGLLIRTTDPADGRVSIITLAAGGRKALDAVHRERCRTLRKVLTNADARRLAGSAALLADLGAALETGRAEAGV